MTDVVCDGLSYDAARQLNRIRGTKKNRKSNEKSAINDMLETNSNVTSMARGCTFREGRENNIKKIVKHVNVGFEEVVHQIEVMEFRALCVINYVLPAVNGHIVLARSL